MLNKYLYLIAGIVWPAHGCNICVKLEVDLFRRPQRLNQAFNKLLCSTLKGKRASLLHHPENIFCAIHRLRRLGNCIHSQKVIHRPRLLAHHRFHNQVVQDATVFQVAYAAQYRLRTHLVNVTGIYAVHHC